MTGPGRHLRPGYILAGIGCLTLVLASVGMGLQIPPGYRGMFLGSSAVLISITLAVVASTQDTRSLRLDKKSRTIRLASLSLAVLALLLAYRYQEILALIPFNNQMDPHRGQPPVAFLPFVLPRAVRDLVDLKGSRELAVDHFTPHQIHDLLSPFPFPRLLTAGIMALTYGAIFAGIASVGAQAFQSFNSQSGRPAKPLRTESELAEAHRRVRPELAGKPFAAFISHASADEASARTICDYLEDRGLRCWIAPRDLPAGGDWSEEILRGVQMCKALVILVSSAANQSLYVISEVQSAAQHRKKFFPLFLENVDPVPGIGLPIKPFHWVHVGTPPVTSRLDEVIQALTAMTVADVGPPSTPSAPQLPAGMPKDS